MAKMIDFSEISQDAKSLGDQLDCRFKLIETAYSARPPCFTEIPTDLYGGRHFDEGEGSELEQCFKDLSLSLLGQEATLLVNLKNSLIVLNRLQAVGLNKQRHLLVGTVTEENGLRKSFADAALIDAKKTLAFTQVVVEAAETAVLVFDDCDMKVPTQDSDVTAWCREKITGISDDMTPKEFGIIQDDVYSKICEGCNALAQLCLERVDVNLGYLHHCSEQKRDLDLLGSKAAMFLGVSKRADYFLSKSFEYLDGVARYHKFQLAHSSGQECPSMMLN